MNGFEIAISGLIIASPAFGEFTISVHIEIELAEIKGRRKRLRVLLLEVTESIVQWYYKADRTTSNLSIEIYH